MVKYFLLIILFIALLSFVMVRRGKMMREKFDGKSEEEIKDHLKRMLP